MKKMTREEMEKTNGGYEFVVQCRYCKNFYQHEYCHLHFLIKHNGSFTSCLQHYDGY